MAYLISFTTTKFNVLKEEENPFNQLYGKTLLLWIKEEVADRLKMQEPEPEDWGWGADIDCAGQTYLLGASANWNDENSYVFQINKPRSLIEKLLGGSDVTDTDECALFFKNLFETEPAFENIKIDIVS